MKMRLLVFIFALICGAIFALYHAGKIIILPLRAQANRHASEVLQSLQGTLFLFLDDGVQKKTHTIASGNVQSSASEVVRAWCEYATFEQKQTWTIRSAAVRSVALGVHTAIIEFQESPFVHCESVLQEWRIVKSLCETLHSFIPAITHVIISGQAKTRFIAPEYTIGEDTRVYDTSRDHIACKKPLAIALVPFLKKGSRGSAGNAGNALFGVFEQKIIGVLVDSISNASSPNVSVFECPYDEGSDAWCAFCNALTADVILFVTCHQALQNHAHFIVHVPSSVRIANFNGCIPSTHAYTVHCDYSYRYAYESKKAVEAAFKGYMTSSLSCVSCKGFNKILVPSVICECAIASINDISLWKAVMQSVV